jgi:hypothetical protein
MYCNPQSNISRIAIVRNKNRKYFLKPSAIAGGGGLGSSIKDLETALKLVETCQKAQTQLGVGQTIDGAAMPAGDGLVASTSSMDTGFGYGYFPNLHIGATGWYLIAAQGGNPFQLGYESFRF